VCAIDFQFDSTIDGKAIKIASMIDEHTRCCDGKTGMSYIPPGKPWNNGHIESFNNRLRKECLNRNYWNTLIGARLVIGDFKDEHNHRHRHSALRAASAPTPRWPAASTELDQTNPTLETGGLSIGESPRSLSRSKNATTSAPVSAATWTPSPTKRSSRKRRARLSYRMTVDSARPRSATSHRR
jgi:Integrase core domain